MYTERGKIRLEGERQKYRKREVNRASKVGREK